MNNKDFLKDIYRDFFGVEDSKKESVGDEQNQKKESNSQEEMSSLFDEINQLYITDASRDFLKKMIEYMRKYDEGIEKNYIHFAFLLETNTSELRERIENILLKSAETFSYLEVIQKKSMSLYKLESNIDNTDSGFLSIYDVEGLILESELEQNKFFHELEEFAKQNKKRIMMITGTKEELTNFFLGQESLKNQYFSFKIEGVSPGKAEIYQNILEQVVLEDELKRKLLDYVEKTYTPECDYMFYQKDLIKHLSFEKKLPEIETKKSLEEVFTELNELVGLEKVKKVLYELVDFIQLKEKAGDQLQIKNLNLHMVFLGNPGTGKTTIARMIADILYNLKYIKENKLIEVSSKDLVAEYVGQTAPKTMQVIEKSLNGVLFIDEAYTLASAGNNSYNEEAIATLIQAMENYRDKLVVIFAGYTNEMREFLNSNSGIVSRIGYTLEFDDYTTEELVQIFLGMMNKSGFIVEVEAITYLKEMIEKYRTMKNFGNARFVRNIYEKTIIKHASRVKNNKRKDILITIKKEDISTENLLLK